MAVVAAGLGLGGATVTGNPIRLDRSCEALLLLSLPPVETAAEGERPGEANEVWTGGTLVAAGVGVMPCNNDRREAELCAAVVVEGGGRSITPPFEDDDSSPLVARPWLP